MQPANSIDAQIDDPFTKTPIEGDRLPYHILRECRSLGPGHAGFAARCSPATRALRDGISITTDRNAEIS
ncbi:hypothetical protein [Novosphingobium sp. BL-8A]|uniref:hypothetical protein n=1 Tax=Novosphingobium sp. BL-8A TaxID=3127639 RepID=UPI0037578C4F